jgi:hypothetical protein
MTSCTSVFTGLLLIAGTDAPAIEYFATGDQITKSVSRVNAAKIFQANMHEASADSLCSGAVGALRYAWNSNRLKIGR